MKKILGAIGLTTLLVAPALAADIPVRAPPRQAPQTVVAVPVYNWSGCYIGANGGYGWGEYRVVSGGVVATFDGFDGPLAGGQIGCNIQTGPFVVGFEGDGQWADIDRVSTALGGTLEGRADWFATIRARLGYAANNVLFYATAGYAHVGLERRFTLAGVTVTDGSDRMAWTAGGGIEFGFASNWSVKGEYLFIRTINESGLFNGFAFNDRAEAHIARVGLNYRFFGGGGSVVARY